MGEIFPVRYTTRVKIDGAFHSGTIFDFNEWKVKNYA